MYAHELFKSYHHPDWQKSLYGQIIDGYDGRFKLVLQAINDSVKFHMGLQSEVNHAAGGDQRFEDVFSQCHLPYDNCWFDYVSDARIESPMSKKIGIVHGHVRAGLLCSSLYDGLFTVNHFTALDNDDSWTMDPVTTFVGNKPLSHYEIMRNVAPSGSDTDGYAMAFIMKSTQAGDSVVSSLADELVYNAKADMSTLAKFLRLLNCKNSVFQDVQVTNKPLKNRKARREPGSFKYGYKLLRLDLGNKHGGVRSLTDIKNLWQNPLHSCRGHFKTYTPDSRLFGKYIGTFWFPPHMRGHIEVGVVKKEYEVTDNHEGQPVGTR